MPTPTVPANLIVEPFGLNASAGDITLPIPVPTQSPANPARASFDTGFPPLTFLPVSSGGIPPSGKDFNGLLFMITAYLAAAQAGLTPTYDATASTAFGGYPVGATLRSASGGFWFNTVAGNTTDPDTGGAGWSAIVLTPTKALQLAQAGGTFNNYLPAGFGASTGFLDLTPSGSNVIITGIDSTTAGDGQQLIVTNLGSSLTVTLNALDTGSLAQNRLRMPANFTLGLNNSIRFVYSKDLSLWVQS